MAAARDGKAVRAGVARRTCVGCRQVRPKRALLRLVRGGDGVVRIDQGDGRGAYVCADRVCVERAARSGVLSRAFRKPTVVGPEWSTFVLRAAGEVSRPLERITTQHRA